MTTGAILVDSSVLSTETKKIRFIISMETTAQEIITKILARFKMTSRDPNLFFMTMEPQNRSAGSSVQTMKNLRGESHPLELQQQTGNNAKFRIQMRTGGVVKVYDSCITSASFYKSLFISKLTTSTQLIQLLLKHYGVTEGPENFLLSELDENGKELRDLDKNDCPLVLQQSSSQKISFYLKRLKKASNLSRSFTFHGLEDYKTKEQHLDLLRRSLRKNKTLRFEDDQTEEERDVAIEELRTNLHQLTNNKSSVFYNGRTTNSKVSLEDDGHKEFLRAKMEILKQRKLLESQKNLVTSEITVNGSERPGSSKKDCNGNRLDFKSFGGGEVMTNGYSQNQKILKSDESGTGSSRSDVDEGNSLSENSSGAITPVFVKDYGSKRYDKNGVNMKPNKHNTTPRGYSTDEEISKIIVPPSNVPPDNVPLLNGSEIDNVVPIALTQRGSDLPNSEQRPTREKPSRMNEYPKKGNSDNSVSHLTEDEVKDEENTSFEPSGSPTPVQSGRDSQLSNVSEIVSHSVDSSNTPTPTPKMDEYSLVEKEASPSPGNAKERREPVNPTREASEKITTTPRRAADETRVSSEAENVEESVLSPPGSEGVVKRLTISFENNTPKKNAVIPLPDAGKTPSNTPRPIQRDETPPPRTQPDGGKVIPDTHKSDDVRKQMSKPVDIDEPRSASTRGRVQNPNTPPQTPRSRTHSVETPVVTPRSRSRSTDTPAEQSATSSRSSSRQSLKGDNDGSGTVRRGPPSSRPVPKQRATSLSDSESILSRGPSQGRRQRGSLSCSEEPKRKPVQRARASTVPYTGMNVSNTRKKTTPAQPTEKANETSVSRKPNGLIKRTENSTRPEEIDRSSRRVDKTANQIARISSKNTKGSNEKEPPPLTKQTNETSEKRPASISKEFRDIVTDRLYQLSRTPSTKRKGNKVSNDDKSNSSVSSSSDTKTVRSAPARKTATSSSADPKSSATPRTPRGTKDATLKSSSVGKNLRPRPSGSSVSDVEEPSVKTSASSGYSSDSCRLRSTTASDGRVGSTRSVSSSMSSGHPRQKFSSLTSEEDSMTDSSMVSDAEISSSKESMPSDADNLEDRRNQLLRRRRRRVKRTLPMLPDIDLEERKRQVFSGAKQKLQRAYVDNNYDTDSSAPRSDIFEHAEQNPSRASTLKDEEEVVPLYLISASWPDTEDTGDEVGSTLSSAFDSPKSDENDTAADNKSRSQNKPVKDRAFKEELVHPIKTKFSAPTKKEVMDGTNNRMSSKVGTHTEEQIYRAKQNLLNGINVTFKPKNNNAEMGYRTELSEDETGSSVSRAQGYVSDQGSKLGSGYSSEYSGRSATGKKIHGNAAIGPLLVTNLKDGIAHVVPEQLLRQGSGQEQPPAGRNQTVQQHTSVRGSQIGASKQEGNILPQLSSGRNVIPNINTFSVQTQTEIKQSNLNRPSLNEVLKSCDLLQLTIEKDVLSEHGIKLFEGVFQPLSNNHSLRSPRGKRPIIGQNKSAFMRVRSKLSNEDEVQSIVSIDKIEDRSAAKQDGRLQEGDYIIEVNGSFVLENSFVEVQSALEGCGHRLQLVVARTKDLKLTKEESISINSSHTDLEKELEKLKLRYNSLLMESQQKDHLIEELRGIMVKRARVRQVKDGLRNNKINVDLLEGECSAV